VSNTSSSATGIYEIVLTATSGSIVRTSSVFLDVQSPVFADIALTAPTDLATGIPTATILQWEADVNATQYDIAVYLDEAATQLFQSYVSNTNSIVITGLTEATHYYWAVRPRNA